jgi:hypothetical protein
VSEQYEFATVRQVVSIVDNQHPANTEPLFRLWVTSGWEVVSVLAIPPTSNMCMCVAIGVIRRKV